MKKMKLLILCAVLVTGCNTSKEQADKGSDQGWVSLFNGKNLDGWTVKIAGYELGENFGKTFRVEDGVIKVAYDQYEKFDKRFGHLFYKEKYSSYRLRLEYRFTGEQMVGGPGWAFRNSGIMLHCPPPETMAKDQSFPVSIETQLLGGNGTDARTTGNVCTPGTHIVLNSSLTTKHCINSTSKTYHGDQWVKAEVEVRSNESIKHFINGEMVLSFTNPQLDPADKDARALLGNGELMLHEGYFALQAESHPVEFRNIEIKILTD